MKKEITGYITASINNYERNIKRMHTLKANAIEIKKYENFANELNDLIDYVTDIPEESQEPITVVLNNTEVETLKNRINELEETCIANNEVIDTQFKRIKEQKEANYMWQNTCIKLREENERLKEEIVKAKEHELPYIDFQKIYDAAQEMEGK